VSNASNEPTRPTRPSQPFPARNQDIVSSAPLPDNPLPKLTLLPLSTSWDSTYTTELHNHASDPSDTGTNWFSDSGAQDKILAYLSGEHLALSKETSFLDLGTGNGEMLSALREEAGFTGEMMGVDYSAQSVELARKVAESKGLEVRFRVWDVLDEGEGGLGDWDVVLDKGTFDAVSLSGVPGVEERYVRQVGALARKGGLVLVTSCNWTEGEVRKWFESGGELDYHGRVVYPTFRFGGAIGQSISTVCFKRRVSD
ncbi:MAG: hypothetical protein Q9195_009486, partial [Heterodermia aff. obscurata]